MLLLRCLVGSHLHGFAHAGSDRDFFEVHDRLFDGAAVRRRPRQQIVGDHDTVSMDLSRFMVLCAAGSPQALEAMFAPDWACEVDLLRALRQGFRADPGVVRDVYRRSIRAAEATGTAKGHRHARRLALNLDELLATGRFDPTVAERLAVSAER